MNGNLVQIFAKLSIDVWGAMRGDIGVSCVNRTIENSLTEGLMGGGCEKCALL